MEKENVIEKETENKDLIRNERTVEENSIEVFNEDKMKLVCDFAPILKNVGISEDLFTTKTGKKITTYYFVVKVDGVRDIKLKFDDQLYTYISTCKNLGVKPFVSKELVKEFSEEKNRDYTCLKLKSNKGRIYRYFIGRAEVESLEMVYDVYQSKNKK